MPGTRLEGVSLQNAQEFSGRLPDPSIKICVSTFPPLGTCWDNLARHQLNRAVCRRPSLSLQLNIIQL